MNADYSAKYFNRYRKGSVVYTFVDYLCKLFSGTVISSSERESMYVIDGLLHNDVVKSDIHTTDTGGFSEAVFGITHMLGFSFAPRIKNMKKQTLYGFKEHSENYKKSDYKISPDKYINTALIKDNWDGVLRFVASIKLKITTASQLFKRLNSYSRTHPLYKTIKELGRIIKTIFILTYIDDLPFRQAIEKQLNLGELSNKFSRAVMVGGNQEFNVGLKEDQQLIEGCKRLIQNSIILWNSLYLSMKLLNAETPDDRDNMIKIIQNGSLMTWSHINFTGEYDFNEEQLKNSLSFDINKIYSLKV